jgi:CPA1 family monovalent cation:H+ antiporter
MTTGELLILVAVGVVTLGAVALLRPVGIPTPVVLVLAGLITGLLPFAPNLSLQPDVVLLGLLPLLVFHTAATVSPTALIRDVRTIGALAIVLVMLTASAVAAVAHWLGDLTWPIAFVLGAAVCPTDGSAATAIARKLSLPRRVLSVLEGEALFNDVIGLVLLAAAITAATTGHLSILHAAGSIPRAAAVGALIGVAVGHLGRLTRDRISDPTLQIAGSILLAYAAYLPAEALHASGVLATALAGLYLGWHRSAHTISAHSRLQASAFWKTLVFLIDAVLFVLLGLSPHGFTTEQVGSVSRLVLAGVGVVATVIAVRLVFMLTAGWLISPSLGRRATKEHPGWRERLILGWAGMRGAITLAAILAVPKLADNGRPLPGRDDLLYLGFAVIFVTLVGQGLTLPALIARLNLTENPAVAESERQARLELAYAALTHLDTTTGETRHDEHLIAGLRAQYLERSRSLDTTSNPPYISARTPAPLTNEVKLRRDINAVQRECLRDLRRSGRIGTTTARTIERDLDLEEATS